MAEPRALADDATMAIGGATMPIPHRVRVRGREFSLESGPQDGKRQGWMA
jgi:hypothetical protein